MRRTLIILTVGMLAVLLLATPGLAGGGNGPGHGVPPVFALQGCITSIDSNTETFVVDVKKSMAGLDLPDEATIHTDDTTRFVIYVDGRDPGFAGLVVNDPVSVRGQEKGGELWAIQVTVNPDCPTLADACDGSQ